MHGIRLPDPMIAGYQPYIDIEPRMIPSTNRSRLDNVESSRDNSPRNRLNYDLSEDSVSALRLNKYVPQTHALGRNVYSSKAVTRSNTAENSPNIKNSNLTRVTGSIYNQDFEGRSINYESMNSELNSTILSNYTEGISSVDSFEYKYYRSNDPDELSEANYNDKHGRESKNHPARHTRRQITEKNSRPSKDSINNHNNKHSNQISKLPIGKPTSNVDTISSGGPNDNSQFYQLTKDELCRGLGSIGLALSKVFSLTGKSVLYLCSSITDNTEGLFETEKNKTDRVADLHTRSYTNHPTCSCSINSNKDYRSMPDLHINYETHCQSKGGRHKYTNGKNNAIFYDKKPEPCAKYIKNCTYTDDIHLLGRERAQMTPNNQESYYRNVNYNKPIDYDRKYANHTGYYNKVNLYENFKIQYDEDLDDPNGNSIPKNGYEHNYPREGQANKNLYRDRELSRGDRMVERAVNNRFPNGYSIDEILNRPKCNVKIPEPSIGLSNLSNHDIRTIQSNNGVQKAVVNTTNRRTMEFSKDNLNAHGCDKLRTVELAERTTKNTLEVTTFGKPCVSAYGANTIESENAANAMPKLGMSDGEITSSYKSPAETEVKYLRTEVREQMSLKGDLLVTHNDQNTDEVDNTSRSFSSAINTDSNSQSNYSVTKSVGRISIEDGSSNKSMDKISIAEYDSDKSVDTMSIGENESKGGSKKKGKKGMFSFGKKSK
ncbi:hypothetical protein MACJ_001216 [Theileria orientalis]|uniref:Uncharacterized protein n=1 Tax=Theileria orientalis TaxID=68886 RepID=A0A976M829_THEOR|nr:hypothetical protein MACJ_001216 [Theileria orientalis]